MKEIARMAVYFISRAIILINDMYKIAKNGVQETSLALYVYQAIPLSLRLGERQPIPQIAVWHVQTRGQ